MYSVESSKNVVDFLIDEESQNLIIKTTEDTFYFAMDSTIIGKMFHEIMRFIA
jgi:hypothetical protein